MARVKCFTALWSLLLLSLLASCLRLGALPGAVALQELGDLEAEVVGEELEVASGGTEVADQEEDVRTSGVWRRLLTLERLQKKKKTKKPAEKKSPYEKKTTDKKKKKKSKSNDDDKKKTTKTKKKKSSDAEKKSSKKVPVLKKKVPKKKVPKLKKKVPVLKKKVPKKKPTVPAPHTPSVPKIPPVPSAPHGGSYGGKGNPIDNCWLGPNWAANRQKLADCAIGFGSDAAGGKGGAIYVVTNGGDDAVNPAPGTLRYGVIQPQPLWIIFAQDFDFKLDNELIIQSYKTIDGRGRKVSVGNGGACFTIQFVSHVIIESITFKNCAPGHSGNVISSTTHTGYRGGSDGDAVSVFGSSHIWVDHCTLSHATDGLIDVIHGSTAVTISNNYFSDHDKVMLLGHSDSFTADKNLKVTIAYNTFGPNLVQRMPRCRHGEFHVINNDYPNGWGIYAIGGSGDPTILSEGNRFVAGYSKQVTKREVGGGNSWSWHSDNDLFLNGAYFAQSGGYDSGLKSAAAGVAQFFTPALTARSGVLDL